MSGDRTAWINGSSVLLGPDGQVTVSRSDFVRYYSLRAEAGSTKAVAETADRYGVLSGGAHKLLKTARQQGVDVPSCRDLGNSATNRLARYLEIDPELLRLALREIHAKVIAS